MSGERIVIEGVLGWANGGAGQMARSHDTYGPGGRWDNHRGTEGDRLADALIDAGAYECAKLLVVAVNRFGDADEVFAAVQAALDALPAPDAGGAA